MNLFPLVIAALAFADISRPEIPETIVKISIFDLIQRPVLAPAKPLYILPPDYGQQVAALVLGKKQELTACIAELRETQARFELELAIAPSGAGKASTEEPALFETKSAANCVQKILGSIAYPAHKLSHPVTVSFPLLLQKKVL
jgi:hypothetical protein